MARMDEQEQTDKLEELCGGPAKAHRLMGIYTTAIQSASHAPLYGRPKTAGDYFRLAARRDGYTDEVINHYLNNIL